MPRRLQQLLELLGWCRIVRRRGCLAFEPLEVPLQAPSVAPLHPPVVVPRSLVKDAPMEESLADTYELVAAVDRKMRVSDPLMCECLLDALGKPHSEVQSCEYVVAVCRIAVAYSCSLSENSPGQVSYAFRVNATFSLKEDRVLIAAILAASRVASCSPLDLRPRDFTMPAGQLDKPIAEVRIRFSFLNMLNRYGATHG